MYRRQLLGCMTFLAITFSACREVYKPRILSSPQSYLVVEGVLNIGGPTSIKLSRTTDFETSALDRERNAQVTVESKDNIAYTLASNGDGTYHSSDLNLVVNNEYRLRILSRGKEYVSEFVTARATPPIDSILWKKNNEGLQIMLNTHDPTNNTRYYRWEFNETWEVRAYFRSIWIYIRDSNYVRRRAFHEGVFQGWKSDSSKSIMLGSTATLQSDIVFRAPMVFIPAGDERPAERYSILVRQYALDQSSHAFFELMKRNTESLGTIFDAQPSEAKGNIHCVSDPGEMVIGYITACRIQEKRIFISIQELGRWDYLQSCDVINVVKNPDSLRAYFSVGYMPIDDKPFYYPGAPVKCVDVTSRGTSLVKPVYW